MIKTKIKCKSNLRLTHLKIDLKAGWKARLKSVWKADLKKINRYSNNIPINGRPTERLVERLTERRTGRRT